MKSRVVVGGWVTVCVWALATSSLLAQEKKGDEKPPARPPAGKEAPKSDTQKEAGKEDSHGQMPSKEQMDAMFAEMAKLAKEHETLKLLAGNWKTQTKVWMGPGDPDISSGTFTAKLILGGRWLAGDYGGTFNGKPFEGFSLWGYNKEEQKFINIWCSTMGTAPIIAQGTADPTGKIITLSCTQECPMDHTMKTTRSVTTIKSPNEILFEMFEPGPDGKEVKMLEVTYAK
ncbi:MAG TPA: DUF1579 domain-containing protein [Phycisphaerae bacterium]|jgi:hypothetical protein